MAPTIIVAALLSVCLLASIVSAVPSAAVALQSPADESGVGGGLRALLQAGNDCSRTVTNCETCRFQMFAGSVTRAICTKCATGYVIKASGRGCCELFFMLLCFVCVVCVSLRRWLLDGCCDCDINCLF
jgi:hypothetical protein